MSEEKDQSTSIRFTGLEMTFLNGEVKRLKLKSRAELVRRLVEEYMSPVRVTVSFPDDGEHKYIQDLAKELGVTPSNAIRIILIQFRTIMQAPLAAILRPTEEVIEEMAKAKEGGKGK